MTVSSRGPVTLMVRVPRGMCQVRPRGVVGSVVTALASASMTAAAAVTVAADTV